MVAVAVLGEFVQLFHYHIQFFTLHLLKETLVHVVSDATTVMACITWSVVLTPVGSCLPVPALGMSSLCGRL